MDADIVVLLLPDTPLTQNILNQHTLNLLKGVLLYLIQVVVR